ncbi:YodL domain-containing protein [Bacillus smithii]|uniref:YodL domain-containing protein n=1 Tax=Bacillus smithii TaxID=1479 RepID=UPI003D1CDD8F
MSKWKMLLPSVKEYQVTLFQTPHYGETQGYEAVYHLPIRAKNHRAALETVFRIFNVFDLLPPDFSARFVATGDIVQISKGSNKSFYRLESGGWRKIERSLVH